MKWKKYLCVALVQTWTRTSQFKNHNFDVVLNSRKPNNDFVNLIKDMAEITVDDFNTYKPDIIINNGFDKKTTSTHLKPQLILLKKA